ncbi:hypothetical protein [Streptomyces sp. NPDC005795]|uniref:hypothetical protein n=1 Tax=Streptomyces sp. NPDC005795 TaxID=3154677 RepID=UPI0033FF2CBA
MINHLLRAASTVALTTLPLALAGPANAAEGSIPSQAAPCAAVTAPVGYVCVPAPKQCITTPCPQYDLVALAPEPWSDVRT